MLSGDSNCRISSKKINILIIKEYQKKSVRQKVGLQHNKWVWFKWELTI